jgi:hypothetical protein
MEQRVSKRYVTTIKLKYVQVSGKCGANRERDYAESSDVQGAINGAEGADARSWKDDNYGCGYPAQRNTAYQITYYLTER